MAELTCPHCGSPDYWALCPPKGRHDVVVFSCRACGEDGYISARDFLAAHPYLRRYCPRYAAQVDAAATGGTGS